MRTRMPLGPTPSATVGKGPFGLFYGWWMVAIAATGQILSGGFYSNGMSVYFLPITRDLNLSRAAVSLAFSLKNLEGGLDAPLVGYLVDRLGSRFMFRAGGILAGIGFVLLAYTHDFLSFLVVFLGALALGFNMGIGLPLATAVNHWFVKQRALAITMAQSGAEFGGAILTPVIAISVAEFGWRPTAIVSGAFILILIPLLSIFLRNTPESIGMRPNGIEAPIPEAVGQEEDSGASGSPYAGDFIVRQALRTRCFWQLSLAIGARQFSKQALLVHLIPLLVWKGFDEPVAASLLGVSLAAQVPLRIGAGWLADRWSMTLVPAFSTLAGAAGVAVLLAGEDGSLALGLVFVLLFALGETGNSPAFAVIGDFFGRRNYAGIRGSVAFVQSLISLPSPVLAGWLYDTTRSYQVALLPIGASYLIAFVLFWTVRPPRPPEPASGIYRKE